MFAKFKKSATPAYFLCATVLLAGCDDLRLLLSYPVSEIQRKAASKEFTPGDLVFDSSKYSRFCFISPLSDLRQFATTEHSVIFSENFFLTLATTVDGLEFVERIHSTWLVMPGGGSLCAQSPSTIKVDVIDSDGRLHLETVARR